MSKQMKDNKPINFAKGGIVDTITNNLNKHGEIKGSNKKETKNLKLLCNHHKRSKKGKIRPTICSDGNGGRVCLLCGQKFTTHLYTKEEVEKTVGKTQALLTQTAYMIQAAELGKDTAMYVANLSVNFGYFPKVYGKVKHVVERTDNAKKKKKKNKGHNTGTESLGSWK